MPSIVSTEERNTAPAQRILIRGVQSRGSRILDLYNTPAAIGQIEGFHMSIWFVICSTSNNMEGVNVQLQRVMNL